MSDCKSVGFFFEAGGMRVAHPQVSLPRRRAAPLGWGFVLAAAAQSEIKTGTPPPSHSCLRCLSEVPVPESGAGPALAHMLVIVNTYA